MEGNEQIDKTIEQAARHMATMVVKKIFQSYFKEVPQAQRQDIINTYAHELKFIDGFILESIPHFETLSESHRTDILSSVDYRINSVQIEFDRTVNNLIEEYTKFAIGKDFNYLTSVARLNENIPNNQGQEPSNLAKRATRNTVIFLMQRFGYVKLNQIL